MTPTPIYKDHTGRWRPINPHDKIIDTPNTGEIINHQWTIFEDNFKYFEFQNSPDTKPGEVVMAYLQWQYTRKGKDDWRNCDDSDRDFFSEYGHSFRQIWILAPSPEASQGNEVRGKEKLIIGEDNICPVTKLPCNDECCSPDSECNVSGNSISGSPSTQSDRITDTGVSAETIEELLVELQDELHYQQYPSDDKVPIYSIEHLEGDYFPLHMVKTVAERYATLKAQSIIADKDKEIANMLEVFKWLMGYYDFPEPPTEGRPRYYWRPHLQAKLKEIGIDIHGCQSPFQPRETDTDSLKEKP